MKESFWHACWEKSRIGFHQKSIHPFLSQYLQPLLEEEQNVDNEERKLTVFVPLCGKSDDMVWLAERMQVVGAELSDIACRDFFTEKNILAEQSECGAFQKYSHKNIDLWQGDFFQLAAEKFPSFDWIYDRAALIALPASLQQRYAEHLMTYLDDSTTLFLISLEFPPAEIAGPPFAVFSDVIESLFNHCHVECIAEHELEDKKFAQRTFKVSKLVERLYLIKKR